MPMGGNSLSHVRFQLCRNLHNSTGSGKISKDPVINFPDKEQEKTEELLAQSKPTFKTMFKQHGVTFLVYWTSLWAGSLGVFFVGLENHWFGGHDVLDLITTLKIDTLIDVQTLDPTVGNLALAVVVNELFEIIRFPVTVATTPIVVKLLQKRRDNASQRQNDKDK